MRTRHDFWHTPISGVERQRVQDAFDDHVGRAAREHAQEEMRRQAQSDRDNDVATMVGMLTDHQRAKPDWWAAFRYDNPALAEVIVAWLYARRRG
jgi:hypothetical protein